MMRRTAALLPAICVVALASTAPPVRAAMPEGPQITVSTEGFDTKARSAIVTMGPGGQAPRAIIDGGGWGQPSWSADGSRLAFGSYEARSGEVVAVAEPGGPGIRFFGNAPLVGDHPVMAPDGKTVAYWYKNTTWLLDVESGSVRRATPRVPEATDFEPSSFSPDGSKLAGTIGFGPAE